MPRPRPHLVARTLISLVAVPVLLVASGCSGSVSVGSTDPS